MSSSIYTFFEEGRSRFFSPLNGSRRELFAACIRNLYDRLHGPNANHSTNLTKAEFKDLLVPVILDYENTTKVDVIDELSDERDPHQMAQRVLKMLIQEGWVEQFSDRQGLVIAFRFSRAGKLFAEAFWGMDQPSRSRQRNMRGCRNSLRTMAHESGDAHDLLDALEYAERVIQDLSDTIENLQERVREAVSSGSLHDQWDSFIDFMEKNRAEIVKQLTVDSAMMNRHDIRAHIETIRQAKGTDRYNRLVAHLWDEAKWLTKEEVGDDPVEWVLERVEDIVCNAYEAKLPSLMRLMDSYFKRITGLLQHAMLLRTGVNRKAFTDTVTRIRTSEEAEQNALLARIGEQIGLARVRLLDPGAIVLKEVTRREKAVASAITPRPSREARLTAMVRIAANEAFHITNAQIVETLKEQVRLSGNGVIKLSSLPANTARDVLTVLRGVESVRGLEKSGLVVRRIGTRFATRYHSGTDYEIRQA